MRQVLGQGWLWLVLLAAVPLARMHGLPLEQFVRHTPDSFEYAAMSREDLLDGENLNHFRTWGYPLFLKVLQYLHPDPDWLWLPYAQLMVHVLAVLVLYAGLRAAGLPVLATTLLGATVLLADLVLAQHHLNRLLSEAVGYAMIVTSLGLFFMVLARPRAWWAWAALVLSVFAAYQVRPAFQALLVALPASGWLLRGRVARPRAFVVGLLVACFVPFLAFCGWRWYLVGDFALTSFTGTNLNGITGTILTADMVPQLKPENRPLAEWLIARRESLPPTERRRYTQWMPPVPPGGSAWDLIHERVDVQFDDIVWRLTYSGYMGPRHRYNQVEIDRAMTDFCLDIIRQAPDVYASVVLQSAARAIIYAAVGRQVGRAALYLLVAALAVSVLARTAAGWPVVTPDPVEAREEADWLALVAAPALTLFAAQTLLTVLVAMPEPRYLEPAALLLPGVLTTAVYIVVRRLRVASAARAE